MAVDNITLLMLAGGEVSKQRVQHPSIKERKDRETPYWYFRYRIDETQPDGSNREIRKQQVIGPSKGPNALTKKQAEARRDAFLAELNSAPTKPEAAVAARQPVRAEDVIFGRLAELWRRDYADNPKVRLAQPTREKYNDRLKNHILPRWQTARIGEFNTRAILDWLQAECTSWYMMADLRNIMSGIFERALEWEVLPETYANPMKRVKIGRKWTVREDRILDAGETAAVFARLADPHLLICETCISTGTRISEAVGLQARHVDLGRGTIKIEQRHCRGDVDSPKTKNSRRLLSLGALRDRYETWMAEKSITKPFDWLFAQEDDRTKPMWDSGVRKALKLAAKDAGCDFEGFGLHSFRRANITMRQEVGGSTIEASRIAGHATVNTTLDYTIVQLARQEELTRAIQSKLEAAQTAYEQRVAEEPKTKDREAA